jgi:hypothetical protein
LTARLSHVAAFVTLLDRRDIRPKLDERLFLDKSNADLLHDEISTIDHALTRPWTVTKTVRRGRNPVW